MVAKVLAPQLLLASWLLFSTGLAVHFELGIPDLTATKRTKDGDVTIKGYRALTNERLLASNGSDIAPQLLWATVGDPRIVKSAPERATGGGGNVTLKVFHFTDSGFYMMMQLKTAEDSELLAKRAALKYGLQVAPQQIRHLLLSKLTCVIDLRDTERRSVRIVGRPVSLRSFPLRVEFAAAPGGESRSLFEKRLADDPDMSVPCSICLSSSSVDSPPDQTGDGNATNVTESSVLPVPPDSAAGGARTDDDCRRRKPSAEAVAAELASLAANLSGLACEAARLTGGGGGGGGGGSPALSAALDHARAACARLEAPMPLQAGLVKNLTEALERAAAAAVAAAASARLGAAPDLRHRLALRAVYNLRHGRAHNLLDSRRLRARAVEPSGGSSVLGSSDGARFRPTLGGGGVIIVDDVGDELSDLLDVTSGWTFFAKLKLDAEQLPQPLLTFWDPGSRGRLLWQLSVGARQISSVLLSDARSGGGGASSGFASAIALRPGAWHRVVAAAQAGAPAASVSLSADGVPLTVVEAPAATAVLSSPADLPEHRRLWLGEAPSGVGGFGGVVGCFGAAAAALTPAEVEAAFAVYCE